MVRILKQACWRSWLAGIFCLLLFSGIADCSEPNLMSRAMYRGPVDLVFSGGENRAVTVNELSATVSLVDLQSGKVLDEKPVGKRPGGIVVIGKDEVLVSSRYSGALYRFSVGSDRLQLIASIDVGFEPLGLSIYEDKVFVCCQASGEVAEVDLRSNAVVKRFAVGKWPRYSALSQDGKRLAVGLSGQSEIAVVNTETGESLYEVALNGAINFGHLELSSDGQQVYFPWMIYRTNPINVRNIQLGWVLASRVARVRMDGPAYREAISLDVPRLAVADPFGIAKTPNEHRLAVSSSGTHELLVYRLQDLPFVGTGGPGDLIDRRLMQDPDLFYRIELGGRPMGLEASSDNQTVFVANHLLDSIQEVDLESREVVREISLGDAPSDAEEMIAHRGMEIFYDAERSLDQWYSCHSCHQDGGTNAKAMDTWNDGSKMTNKTVLPLAGLERTGPWTWHGWQEDLSASLQNSFVSTMQGKEASQEDLAALRKYLGTLEPAPNPFQSAMREVTSGQGNGDKTAVDNNDMLRQTYARGKDLFFSADVGCSDCHSGSNYTDGEIHDVGMVRETDMYEGYNTPSLVGVYKKPRLLHDGRAKSLEVVLKKWHRPDEIGGGAELSDSQLADLVAFLKTL
ncbi:MAG: hypothetical protein AAF483_13190 [Planctomycetota bacterium]